MANKPKTLGRSLENRIAARARAKGLDAERHWGSGQIPGLKGDGRIEDILYEAKVRTYSLNARGEKQLTIPIADLRKVQVQAEESGREQGVLVVNAKGSSSPFVLMGFDWFLGVLAQREKYHEALKQIVDGVDVVSPPISAFWLQNIAALALDKDVNEL